MRRHEYLGGELEQKDSLKSLYDDIETANQMLSQGELEQTDIDDLIKEFDKRWPYHNREITLLGTCYVPLEGKKKDEDDLSGYLIVAMGEVTHPGGLKVISHGFNLIPESEGEVSKIAHYFRRPIDSKTVQVGRSQSINFVNFGYAHIDEVEVLSVDTPASRDAKIRYSYPELVDIIDETILNEDTLLSALIKLGEIRYPYLGDEDDSQRLVEIGEYIYDLLGFEKDMPYILSLNDGSSSIRVCCAIESVDWAVFEMGQDSQKFLCALLRIKRFLKDGSNIQNSQRVDPETITSILNPRELSTD